MIAENPILAEKKDGIATLTMNRPKVLNTLHPDLVTELLAALKYAEKDAEVKAVVLTGAGKAFCAGGDLPYIESLDSITAGAEYITLAGSIASAITELGKPVIAMVNGVAAGAGFNIALACDIVFCAKSARFAQSFAKVGLVPDCGGTYFLPRAVGLHKAKELTFTAELIDAETALQLGIVNRVVEDQELREVTYRFAGNLAKSASIAISYIKKMLNQSDSLDLKKALELETAMQCLCIQTSDHKEGIKAFKEKRPPVFEGR